MFHKKNIALLFLLCLKLSQTNTMENTPDISECEIPNMNYKIEKPAKLYNLISQFFKSTSNNIDFSSPSFYDIGVYNKITFAKKISSTDYYLNKLNIHIPFDGEYYYVELTCELKENQENTPKKISFVDIKINNWEISHYIYDYINKKEETTLYSTSSKITTKNKEKEALLKVTDFKELLEEIGKLIPKSNNHFSKKNLSK